MNKHDLTSKIKTICREQGFSKCGFAKAEKLIPEEVYYKQWLDENRNADMGWMERNFEKRMNPELLLEGAKSIIALALLYDTPFEHPQNTDTAKVSRYAWGKSDYHNIIKKKLKTICGEIEKLIPDVKLKSCVDSAPIAEKAWALRAGIGWLGKHSNIIDGDTGSFFFLSEIVINKELEYDESVEDMCGTCRICVEACPTGAIYKEYKVDANLCISYHTIENKNEIPDYINLDNWVFGCDVCQDVCPYNKRKFFTDDKSLFPLPLLIEQNANELSNMSEEKFNELFKHSAVKRTKYSGWIRNLRKVME